MRCCCFFISSLLGVLRDKKEVTAVRGPPMQVCSSRSSITGFGFVGFVSGCLYWFSFLVLFLFHSFFFLLLLCACFLLFRCYLFIYCARATVPARVLVACARACAWHTMCLRAWLVLVLRFFAFYYLLFLFMCYIQGTFRYVKAFDGDTWKWYVSSESI